MKEAFILKTISLHSSPDVVHIESIGYDQSEALMIEYDARALLEDIPSLYRMAKQSIEQGEKYERKKYKEFEKQLAEDFKGKRGRPRK
jgi:hypothetical protein